MIPGLISRNSRRFYGYLKKDATLLYKRKKYLYIFILLPIIIASLFLFALNPGDYDIAVGVCDFDKSETSAAALSNLKGFEPVLLEDADCLEHMQLEIKKGHFDLGLEIGDGFEENLMNLKQSKLVIYYDNTDVSFSNLVSWKVDQSLTPFKRAIIDSLNKELTSAVSSIHSGVDIFLSVSSFPLGNSRLLQLEKDIENLESLETEFLVNPIWTEKRPIYEEDLQKDVGIVYIFPILSLFIILMLASTSIIYDKHTHFLTRVKSTTTPISYILAKTLFFTFLVLIQFILILIIFMIFGADYFLPPFGLLQLLLIVGLTNTLLGFIIGLVAQNEGIAVLFSLMISFPLMLVSGVFFPRQVLPEFVQWIGSILPLHHQINAAKSVLLFGQTISNYWFVLYAVLFACVWWLIRKN